MTSNGASWDALAQGEPVVENKDIDGGVVSCHFSWGCTQLCSQHVQARSTCRDRAYRQICFPHAQMTSLAPDFSKIKTSWYGDAREHKSSPLYVSKHYRSLGAIRCWTSTTCMYPKLRSMCALASLWCCATLPKRPVTI